MIMKNVFIKLSVSVFVIMINLCTSIAEERSFLTHNYNQQLDCETIKERINSSDNLCIDKEEELEMVDELQKFELGQFLLKNKGLNGYWSSYVIHDASQINLDNPLENWIINRAPLIKATQEQHHISQTQINQYMHPNSIIASVPCGTMHELHSLNFDGVYDIKLVGVDLDEESINIAKANFKPSRFCTTELYKQDAWNLQDKGRYNVMISNGLNIYEPDDDKVVSLYSQFHDALTSQGVLITSFFTPPPEMSNKSTWKNYNQEDLLKQKALFSDIIQAKWQVYRTEDETRDHLEKAGFKVVRVIYDSQGMFPTVVAQKKI